MRPAATHILLCILTLPLAACAVDSATAARLQRGIPAKTVVQAIGQPDQFFFRARLPDADYEARLYNVGSADLPYCFIYRNDALWKITTWQFCDCKTAAPSTLPTDHTDWSQAYMDDLCETLQRPDCRFFPPNHNPLLYVAWAGEMTFFVPFAGAVCFPLVVADLTHEPSYSSIIARYDPERIHLGQTVQYLDHELGPPTELISKPAGAATPNVEWRYYNPELAPIHAPPLLFQGAGVLIIQSRHDKVTTIFSYSRY